MAGSPPYKGDHVKWSARNVMKNGFQTRDWVHGLLAQVVRAHP
ncbi:MAG: hypothetical protein ACQJCO_04845 [cyanobacterium endosymbiont of Rhopalodia sterrenbergii]